MINTVVAIVTMNLIIVMITVFAVTMRLTKIVVNNEYDDDDIDDVG